MRSLILVALGTAAVLAQECASRCGSWHFPPNQIASRFELYPLHLPNAFTIEAWVKRSGPAVSNRWMFSLATPATDNCILLSSAALPDSGWHHIMVTSGSKTFLDGVDASRAGFAAPGLQNRNGGAACAVAGSSFVINIDQDSAAPPHALDPIQASDLLVNSVAIFNMSFSQAQASSRYSSMCYVTPTVGSVFAPFAPFLVAAWWGMDSAYHPVDRTFPSTPPGPLVQATLTLPLSGIEQRGPRCQLPPPSPPSPPSPPPPPPPPPSPPRPLGYCKSACTSWRFPRAQTSYRFQIYPIELPAAYTIEGWVRHVGDPRTTAQGTYFFSFATPANDNCILLNAVGLQDSAWHHVAVTSEGYVFLNGERTEALGTNNVRGTACAGKPNSAFVLNIDQDAPAHSLDPEQAANLISNGIAIWDRALTEAQAYERYARGCFGGLDGAWSAWYPGEGEEGEDDEDFQETTAAGNDRTGHHRDAQVYLPWPGGLPKEGPSCLDGPPRHGSPPPPDKKVDSVSKKEDNVGGAYGLGVFALLFALAGLLLAVYNGGFLERFGVGPDVRRRARPSVRSSSMTAVSMGMPLAVNDSAAGSYSAASLPPAASVTPLGAKC